MGQILHLPVTYPEMRCKLPWRFRVNILYYSMSLVFCLCELKSEDIGFISLSFKTPSLKTPFHQEFLVLEVLINPVLALPTSLWEDHVKVWRVKYAEGRNCIACDTKGWNYEGRKKWQRNTISSCLCWSAANVAKSSWILEVAYERQFLPRH